MIILFVKRIILSEKPCNSTLLGTNKRHNLEINCSLIYYKPFLGCILIKSDEIDLWFIKLFISMYDANDRNFNL